MSAHGSPYPHTMSDLDCRLCGLYFRNASEMWEHRDKTHGVSS